MFVQDHVSPAELPVEMNAFKSQQHRWAKGSIQTFLKLMPRILQSDQPFQVKAEAFFHLSANFNYPLMCVLSVLMAPSMVIRYNMGWYEMLLIDIPLFFAATASVANFYMVCQRELYPQTWTERLKYLPFLMSIGIGLAVNNTKAVFEALFHKPSEFVRTPKYAVEGNSDEWSQKKYRQSVSVQPMIELALGLYFTATLFYALANGIYGTVPFLMLFQVGFLYTGMLSLFQQYGARDGAKSCRAKKPKTSNSAALAPSDLAWTGVCDSFVILLCRGAPCCCVTAAGVPAQDFKVPVDYFTLPNGLKVVVSEDHTAPVVLVEVIYNIGFRVEPKGRTGFAHLFEHMMFQGSAQVKKMEHVSLMQEAGGIVNGSTRFDYTNYFQALPVECARARAIWLEADRMRSLDVSAENLKNQQNVVSEEVRVNVLNQPHGAFEWLDIWERANTNWHNAHNFYGDLDELEAATLDDVAAFFKTYYAPNNAVLVVVGDTTAAEVQAPGREALRIDSAPAAAAAGRSLRAAADRAEAASRATTSWRARRRWRWPGTCRRGCRRTSSR